MDHATLKVIHNEHAALAVMPRSLSILLGEHRRPVRRLSDASRMVSAPLGLC